MDELRVGAGHWMTMDDQMPPEDLIIQPIGPPLPGIRHGFQVVHGKRRQPGRAELETVTVQIRRDSASRSSGPG